MAPGVAGRRTRDYVRHGTTTLFAAPDVAAGAVIGKRSGRHRAADFLSFLKEIKAAVPEGLDVHLVMDNHATHRTEKVGNWLVRRSRWHVHFTPAPASWLRQVERWFVELTRKKLRRGVHRSVAELNADILSFIHAHNERPNAHKWIKSADEILASVRRFCLKANELG